MSTAHASALQPQAAGADARRLRRGTALGLLGMTLFALTIPMTRLASGRTAGMESRRFLCPSVG